MSAPTIDSADVARLSAADRAAYQAFSAITDPAERAKAITAWGRPRGNLRPPFRQMRTAALAQLRTQADEEGRKLTYFAHRVGLSVSRFCRLSKVAEGAQP